MNRKKRTIEQFMWGYQDLFRRVVEQAAEAAFKTIGFAAEPMAVLIGFQVAGDHLHKICIEPEAGPYQPADIETAYVRAEELYNEHPLRNTVHSHPEMHDRYHTRLRLEANGRALAEALQTHHASVGQVFFAGTPTRVDDYLVYVVLGVPKAALETVPQLRTTWRDRYSIAPSLVHALIDEILDRAGMKLYVPDAGADLDVLGVGIPEVVRSATGRFVGGAMLCAGSMFGRDHDLLFSSISALPYEGRAGSGTIIVAEAGSFDVNVILRLRDPVKIGNTRAVRKLMEASDDEVGLLCHDGEIYGLGRVSSNYNKASETVFVVSLLGRGAWDLYHGEQPLLSVRDGVARLPINVLDVDTLKDLATRLFTAPDTDRLIALARAASDNENGAMLVISADAAGEASRLSPQSWSVDPLPLTPELLRQLTAMDGAVLVDPKGYCHAIGVILDGRADGQGDPARGSRFNNAVRYLDYKPRSAVVVVYSADGGIDVLPHLEPRVSRKAVESAIQRYLDVATDRPPEYVRVYRAWDVVKSFRFYLSQEQCDLLNRAHLAINGWRLREDGTSIEEAPLAPDARMDETYWID